MPITVFKEGGFIVEGAEGMKLFRMRTLLTGLKAEALGMRLTSKAPRAATIVRREWGLKLRGRALIEAFAKLVDEQSAKVTRVYDAPKDQG